jgi:hypothetical protein
MSGSTGTKAGAFLLWATGWDFGAVAFDTGDCAAAVSVELFEPDLEEFEDEQAATKRPKVTRAWNL